MTKIDVLEKLQSYLIRGGQNNSFAIESYNAYVTKIDNRVGAFIPCVIQDKFHEEFSSVEIQYLPKIIIADKTLSGLYLFMHEQDTDNNILNHFATICLNFIDLNIRESIVANPLGWWNTWKFIIGNRIGEKMVYSLISEMMVYHYLMVIGKNYTWTGADKKRIDFAGNPNSIEVKSTIKRTSEEITVHGVFQMMLCDDADLDVVFCRLEENPRGKSINDMIEILVADGCNRGHLEQIISDCGFYEGKSDRNIPYLLLEARKYHVDDKFPKIVPNSFADGKIPAGIKQIDYVVDLANLEYKKIDIVF